MVHIRDIDQVHFCLDRHVGALICWICNENLRCISYSATGLCPYVHGNSVYVGYFCRRILYDMHHKSSLDLLSNNFFLVMSQFIRSGIKTWTFVTIKLSRVLKCFRNWSSYR